MTPSKSNAIRSSESAGSSANGGGKHSPCGESGLDGSLNVDEVSRQKKAVVQSVHVTEWAAATHKHRSTHRQPILLD